MQIPAGSPFSDEAKCDAASCARDRIFDAATKLFYRYGIRGVSVDAIAAEAHTTKVTLYRVFDSKDALVLEVLEHHAQRFWGWWDSVVAKYPGDARAQLDALFKEMRELMLRKSAERGCPLTNAAVEVGEDDPGLVLIRRHKGEISTRLRALCREMKAREPDLLGDSLSLLVNGMFAARVGGTEQVASVYDAAQALLDSPALGAPRRAAKR